MIMTHITSKRHIMKSYKELLNEGKKDYEIYHDTFTSVVMEVRSFVSKNGFEISEDDDWNNIAIGQPKPKKGKTNKYNIPLQKNNKPSKKRVIFQVYNRETNKKTFELNLYLS